MSAHKGFFKQMIYKFFCDDLESCLKVSKTKQGIISNPSFDGGLNFTAGLVIVCVIEMMAGFYKGKRLTDENDVVDFLEDYFSEHNNLFKDREFAKYFHRVVRHGLVHEYSPKASAVGMNFNSSELLTMSERNKEELPIINVPTFYNLTVKALQDYEKDLDNGLYIQEFNKRYNEQIQEDYNEMRILKKKFKSLTNKGII